MDIEGNGVLGIVAIIIQFVFFGVCVCVPISMAMSVWSHSETFIPPLPLMGDLFLADTKKTFILSAIEGGSHNLRYPKMDGS